jgi:hypothetical protein
MAERRGRDKRGFDHTCGPVPNVSVGRTGPVSYNGTHTENPGNKV